MSTKRIEIDFNEENGSVYGPNGVYIGYLDPVIVAAGGTNQVTHNADTGACSSPEKDSTDTLVALKVAGFSSEEIIKMAQAKLI